MNNSNFATETIEPTQMLLKYNNTMAKQNEQNMVNATNGIIETEKKNETFVYRDICPFQ